MVYLVLYDIGDDRIRTKVAHRLVAEGYERIQYSVYAGLRNPLQVPRFWTSIQHWLSKETSAKFYMIPVTIANFQSMQRIDSKEWDIDVLTGQKSCIFI